MSSSDIPDSESTDSESTVPEPAATPSSSSESAYSETSGIAAEFLEILVCPIGKAPLEHRDGYLVCTRCGAGYAIRDGIPEMLIETARLPDGVERIEDLVCYAEAESSSTD